MSCRPMITYTVYEISGVLPWECQWSMQRLAGGEFHWDALVANLICKFGYTAQETASVRSPGIYNLNDT